MALVGAGALAALAVGTASPLPVAASPQVSSSSISGWTYTLDDTIPAGPYATYIALSPQGTRAYIADNEPGTPAVRVINTVDDTVIGAPIPLGAAVGPLAFPPSDDTLYVALQGASHVSLIRDDTIIGPTIATALYPQGIALTDDTAYVPSSSQYRVSVVRTSDNTEIATIPVGNYSQGVAVTPNGQHAYVAHPSWARVSKIRTSDDTVSAVIQVQGYPFGVAATDDTVFVTNASSNTVSVIRISDDTVVATIPVGTLPFGVAVSPDGRRAYVANNFDYGYEGTVSVIDTATNTVDATVTLPMSSKPWGIAVSPDGHRVYVVGYGTQQLYVIGVDTHGSNSPGRPTAVTTTPGNQSASVAWTEDDTGGSPLTRIDFALGNTSHGVDDSTTNTTSPHTISGLTNGQAYRVYVRAVNANGPGPWSLPVGVTPSPPPGAPTSVTASAGDASATVSWVAPTPNANPVTHYSVYEGSSASGPWTLDETTTATSADLAGLRNWVPYWFKVTATNAAGEGAGAFTASSVTPEPPPPTPPGPPTAVSATAGVSSVSVSWHAPADAGTYPITSYQVQVTPGGQTCVVSAPSLTCDVAGLLGGTSYTFAVRALTGSGWGPWSAQSNAVTPLAPVAKSIVIAGSRDTTDTRVISVSGTTTGLVGETVTPWVKCAGQAQFSAGIGTRTVDSDGSFGWSRKSSKKTYVYFAGGGVRSNRVIIGAR